MLTSSLFWKDTFVRSVRTFAQALVAIIGVGSMGILDANWVEALSVAGMAAVVSVLNSVAAPAGPTEQPVYGELEVEDVSEVE